MKKILLLFLILCCGQEVMSQYSVQYSLTLQDPNAVDVGFIQVRITDVPNNFIFNESIDGNGVIDPPEARTFTGTETFNGLPTRVDFFSQNAFADFEGPNECSGINSVDVDLEESIFFGPFTGIEDDPTYFDCELAFDFGFIRFRKINDLNEPEGTEREVCPEDIITITPENGPIIREVLYSTSATGTFIPFESFALDDLRNSVDIDLSTLDLSDTQIIRIQLNYGNLNSNPIIYEIFNCSPALDGPVVDIQPSCNNSINTSDNNNGSFTVTFDRELESNEEMNLQVFRQNDGTTTFNGFASVVLDRADFTGRAYTWTPRNLPGGTYRLFWQTKTNGEDFDNIDSVPDAFDQSDDFILTVPPVLTISGISTPVQCAGGDDGSITVTPNGGTPGTAPAPSYEFSIDNGNTWQANTLFDTLISGDYTILMRDANGCIINSNLINVGVQFTSIPVIINSPTTTGPRLIGGNDGQIAISINGGSGIYTNFDWTRNEAPFTPPIGSTDTNIIDLSEGTYTLVVTDSNGCSSEIETFVLTDPEPIGIGITSNPTILNCSFDTAILTASASGGFLNPGGDYQYLWNDGTTESTLIDALVGVTYSLTVTDQGGNSNTQSFTVLGPDPINIVVNEGNVSCINGDDGTIQLNISGGTPFDPNINPERYTVVWTKIGDPTFNQSGISINQLTAGFYEYQITDQNECRYDNFATPIEIVEPLTGVEVFELVNEHVDNTVFQGQEGILEVSVINNTGAFSIQWFKDDIPFTPPTGSTDTRLINLEAGRYTLELINGGCIATLNQPIVITEPLPLQIQSVIENDISCNLFDDGNITVIVIGGVTPYTYAWQKQGDPDFIRPDDSTINELSPGQYTVTITDDSGSSIEITSPVFDITQPDPLVIQLQGNIGVSCPLGNDGAIDISIEGGTPPYNILWSNGRDTEDIDTLEVGDYTVSIVDDNGCTAQTTISVINQPNQITIQEEIINQVSTFQGTDGSIELRVNGGQQPYTFSWVRLSDNTPLGNTNQINNLIADTYMVTITDAIGCVISPTYQISQPDIIVPTITPLLCNADCNAAIQIEVNEGEGNFTYLWSTGATTDTITGLCAGIYTVTVSGFPNGDITRNYEIIDPEPLRIELDEERFICLGQTATLAPPSIDPNASYNWSADNGFTSNQAQINVNQSGIYTLLVTNSNGCTASDTITVNEVDSLINPEFLISSQVFTNEKFVVIDVTNPMPDQIEWIIPEQATIVNQNQDLIELYFELPGEYEISMSVSLGDCTDIYSQKVLVIESNTSEENPNQQENENQLANIREFNIAPNPSNGQFSVTVELKEQREISVKIFSLVNNALITQQTESGQTNYLIPFNLQVASGLYAVVLETPFGRDIRKIVVQ